MTFGVALYAARWIYDDRKIAAAAADACTPYLPAAACSLLCYGLWTIALQLVKLACGEQVIIFILHLYVLLLPIPTPAFMKRQMAG